VQLDRTRPPAEPRPLADKRKRTVYLPQILLEQIEAEALRQACSVSRIVQLAWVQAVPMMSKFPTMNALAPPATEAAPRDQTATRNVI
jgi:uncharacterized small protein (TIGR04563 family)